MEESLQTKEKFQKALDAIKKLKSEVSELKAGQNVPIAIIGIGCRYPNGVDTFEKFKELIERGENTVTDIPEKRWEIEKFYSEDGGLGKMNVKKGSFLENVEYFDNSFFQVPPIEAEHMDPQLRLFMMVAQEALENAGLTFDKVKGSNTGVFVGSTGADYSLRNFYSNDSSQIDTYAMTGVADYSKAGRLAYFYDLKGPSVTVNTACSSSLTAFHLACQSLRTRESDIAITGGANLILSPHSFIALSQMNALSKEGISRTFDKDANGYSRGEAVGIVVLKRLSDALENNDNILAVMRGSALNQDGKSNGFTAPNGASQVELIKKALDNAGLTPEDVDYIETHGTGTSLGDPIELEAIRKVFARGKERKHPLYVGAVKTNIGHTEAAAGISGIIKAVAALQDQKIYKHLHLETLNPFFDWSSMPIKVSDNLTEWKNGHGPRRAGVSSFGVSGTNVHVILEEPPKKQEVHNVNKKKNNVLTISAHSKEALKDYATKYTSFLEETKEEIVDICANAIYNRTHFKERVSVSGTKGEIIEKLRAVSNGETDVFSKTALEKGKFKPVFIFPGQGSQWIGMGRDLYKEETVFKNKIDECEKAFSKYVDWSLVEELKKDEKDSQFKRIDIIQPTLFAVGVAIAELWKSWGVEPAAVIGHSMGEVAATHVAGAISLDDAAMVICTRSKLMLRLSGKGSMAVVGYDVEEATRLVADYDDKVAVAVSNSQKSTVISGETATIKKIVAKLEQEDDVFCKLVNVDVASHSPQVDELKEDLLEQLKTIHPIKSKIPIFSTVLGQKVNGDELNAEYWVSNLRNPVRFYETTIKMLGQGFNLFIESSPHPVLESPVEQIIEETKKVGYVLSSYHKDVDEQTDMLQNLGLLHAVGYPVNWNLFYPETNYLVKLPTYPWQLKPFWIEAAQYSDSQIITGSSKISSINEQEQNNKGASQQNVGEKLTSIHSFDERLAYLKDYILKMVTKISGKTADQLDDETTFTLLGVDSLILMRIRMNLEKDFNKKFPVKIFWTNSTISKLSVLLLSELGLSENRPEANDGLVDGWLDIPKPNKDAPMRLFCFHPAGGMSSMYHKWVGKISNNVELVAVELPGRGSRIDEIAYDDKAKLVKDLTPIIAKNVDKPFMFFGHCMGGLILFEVARKLRKDFNIQPEKIFISASPHPEGFVVKYQFHLMSDLELGDLFAGLRRENFQDDEYYNMMLRVMRADIQLGKMYELLEKDVPPLEIPIVSLGPVDDELSDMPPFRKWEQETTGKFEMINCCGGHGYIDNNADMLTSLVNTHIEEMLNKK